MIKRPSLPLRDNYSSRVKGIISNTLNPIPYRQLVDDGDWTPYKGTSWEERQKYGKYDTSDCWEYSPTKQIEMQFNLLYKRGEFSNEAIVFFQEKNILDANGHFNISDQFYDALSGNLGNGGTAEEYFNLVKKYGIIPHSLLHCTDEIANRYSSQEAFDAYYYSIKNITQEMYDIGKESLQYFSIRCKRIGSMWNTPDDTMLATAIKQAPLAYGVPVNIYTWNQENVPSLVSGTMNHEVTGYKFSQGMSEYPIVDNYAPYVKTLTKPYSLNSVIQLIITAIPEPIQVPQSELTLWQKVWQAVNEYFSFKEFVVS